MPRTAKRAKKRLACRIVMGRQRFSGVILDLSASGLFVQTTARPRPLDTVTVEISMPGQRDPLRVEAQVARLRVVPPQLVIVAQGGVGLRITNAPEGYFAFLSAVLPERAAAGRAAKAGAGEPADGAPRPVSATPAPQRYRVRLSQVGGARSRTLHVRARSAQEAAALAVEATGEGWKLLEASEDDEPGA